MPDSKETIEQRAAQTTPIDDILGEIAEQAATGTALTPLPEEWARALPELDDVACQWTLKNTLQSSYMWFEDGDYYATNLPSGLEDREDTPLDRYQAEALLEGVSHEPVDISEVPGRE